tara:strand:- start:2371 stop:2574 length:204 start_codon:yes stop_codon:yes gene_type:complete
MDLAEQFPWLAWWGERVLGSLLILFVLFCGSRCWTSARENQRMALSDWDDRCREERRGLLMPSRRMA